MNTGKKVSSRGSTPAGQSKRTEGSGRRRLSRTDWLDHGLKILARRGPVGLKAEPLAKSLNVSRGSFYWHFHDLADFHAGLLARWRLHGTDNVIAVLDQAEADPRRRLQRLLSAALNNEDRLERGMRLWAHDHRAVAEAVAAVDQTRMRYVAALLREAGVSKHEARRRARLVYLAYVGRIMGNTADKSMSVADITAMTGLLLADAPQ